MSKYLVTHDEFKIVVETKYDKNILILYRMTYTENNNLVKSEQFHLADFNENEREKIIHRLELGLNALKQQNDTIPTNACNM